VRASILPRLIDQTPDAMLGPDWYSTLPGRPVMPSRNSRIGLTLFVVYLALYGGFVFLNAFAPATMEATPWVGINVAILYGCGLIVAAVALALLYGMLCRDGEEES
jgi:uncharacterized membrane protein (DUF485 family)